MATITMLSTRQLMAPTPDKLAPAGDLHTMLQGWINPGFETSPEFFLTYVDMYVISTQENPMKKHRCFRTRTNVTATMAASGLGSYHCPYLGRAQARCIGVIPTLWVTPPVLSLGEIHWVGER